MHCQGCASPFKLLHSVSSNSTQRSYDPCLSYSIQRTEHAGVAHQIDLAAYSPPGIPGSPRPRSLANDTRCAGRYCRCCFPSSAVVGDFASSSRGDMSSLMCSSLLSYFYSEIRPESSQRHEIINSVTVLTASNSRNETIYFIALRRKCYLLDLAPDR